MFEMEFVCVPEQLDNLLSSWCEVASAEGFDFFPARAGEFEPLRTRVGDAERLLSQVREASSGSLFLELAGGGVAHVSFPETFTEDVEFDDRSTRTSLTTRNTKTLRFWTLDRRLPCFR